MTGLRFRVAGIPVRVEPVFFLVMLFIGGIDRPFVLVVSFIAVGFISILFHELAHAVAFRAFGRSPSIQLHAFGGATGAPGPALSRARDIVVSAAGPISQIVLLGIPALLLRIPVAVHFQSITWYVALSDAAWINLAWGVLNLTPILPLDGGRITAGLLGGRKHGMRITHAIGIVVASAGVAWGLWQQRFFLAMFGAMFAATNVQALRGERDAPHRERIRHGHRSIDASDTAAALVCANEVMAGQGVPAPLRAAAVELAAWAHLARGDGPGAGEALTALPAETERSGFLAGYSLIESGDAEAAVVVLARAFAAGTDGPPNRMLAARLVRDSLINRVADALRSIDDGDGRGLGELAETLRAAGFGDEAARLSRS